MNWIQKIGVFIGLILVLLFPFAAKEESMPTIIPLENSSSSVSVDSFHSSDFIQPQVSNTGTACHKTPDYTITKYLENFLIPIPEFKITTFLIRFAKQDINRCEMVSLLLFPFHSFW
ncbi:hypothetical protein [Flavobacterium sp. LB2R40]|uniref:hypothetical protein n=1 Tax=Flavobacterium sp. LB2R40 TaxID=3401722 RepID=UPI003AB0CA07